MANIFISLLYICLSFQFFIASYQLNGINRTISFIPKTVIENSVIITSSYEECYIDRTLLSNNMDSYLSNSITRYIDKYTVKYLFMDENGSITSSGKPKGLIFTFKAKVYQTFTYQKAITYIIRENNG